MLIVFCFHFILVTFSTAEPLRWSKEPTADGDAVSPSFSLRFKMLIVFDVKASSLVLVLAY